MAVGEGFVIDQNFRLVPVMDEIEEVEQVLDFSGSENRRMADPFSFSFFTISRIPLGQDDGFSIVGMEFVPENESDSKNFCGRVRMKNILELVLGGRIRIHIHILPENGDREQIFETGVSWNLLLNVV